MLFESRPATCSSPRPPSCESVDAMDRELVERIARGDREALQCFYHSYFTRLCRLVASMMPEADGLLIETIVNEATFEFWKTSGRVDTHASIPVWIMRLTVTEAQRAHSAPRRPMATRNNRSNQPSSGSEAWIASPRLRRVLRPLSVAQRAAIHLVCTGYNRQQVAEILRIPTAAVDIVLSDARRHIRCHRL